MKEAKYIKIDAIRIIKRGHLKHFCVLKRRRDCNMLIKNISMLEKRHISGIKIVKQLKRPKMKSLDCFFEKSSNCFKMVKTFLLAVLVLLLFVPLTEKAFAQSGSGLCEDHVPFYVLDLAHHPEADTILNNIALNPQITKKNKERDFF